MHKTVGIQYKLLLSQEWVIIRQKGMVSASGTSVLLPEPRTNTLEEEMVMWVCRCVFINIFHFLQEFVDSVSYTTRSCKPATLFIVRTDQVREYNT